MDFVRYPGATWGYTATSLAQYKHDTGATATPAPEDARLAGVAARPSDKRSCGISMPTCSSGNPSVKLSAALICFGGGPASAADWIYTSAYRSVFQDWREWLANGYIDFGVPMNYDSDWIGREQGWFDRWVNFEKDSGSPIAW